MNDIDEILDIVAERALIDRSKLVREAKLTELNISSLDMVEVLFALEDRFDINLPFNANTNVNTLETLGDVIDYVESQLMAKRPKAANE